MPKDLAVILNSGSIGSAVTTALAAQKYRPVMLHVEATTEPGSRLRAAYDQQVAHFKPFREHTLPMPFLTLFNKPTHTAVGADPRQHSPIKPELISLLPMVAAAAQIAIQQHAAALFVGLRIGSSVDELAQAMEYLQIWSELLQHPCQEPNLDIQAPLLELEPWQVVDLGFQVAAPFERAWSCDEPGSNEPCWACPGCREREAAFQRSGKPDPIRVVRRV